MENKRVVDPIGIGGGLVLFFNNSEVELLEKTKNFIYIRLVCPENRESCRITWTYADCVFWLRQRNWDKLREISRGIREPWLCIGDFNDITHQNEKLGGDPKMRDVLELLIT